MSLKRGIGPRSTSPLMSLGLYLRANDCENARQVGRGTPAPKRSQARLRSNENHPADGIIIRPKSRALFQKHRPKAEHWRLRIAAVQTNPDPNFADRKSLLLIVVVSLPA